MYVDVSRPRVPSLVPVVRLHPPISLLYAVRIFSFKLTLFLGSTLQVSI